MRPNDPVSENRTSRRACGEMHFMRESTSSDLCRRVSGSACARREYSMVVDIACVWFGEFFLTADATRQPNRRRAGRVPAHRHREVRGRKSGAGGVLTCVAVSAVKKRPTRRPKSSMPLRTNGARTVAQAFSVASSSFRSSPVKSASSSSSSHPSCHIVGSWTSCSVGLHSCCSNSSKSSSSCDFSREKRVVRICGGRASRRRSG